MIPLQLQFALNVMIWGSTFFAITTQVGPGAPYWSISYRFVVAGLVLLALSRAKSWPQVTLAQHVRMALIGLFLFCGNFFCTYTAEKSVPSGVVAVAFALLVVLNPILGRLFLGQRLSPGIVAGALMAISGVVMLFWPEIGSMSLGDGGLIGSLLAVTGVLLASFGNVAQALGGLNKLPAMLMNGWAMLYGGIFAGALAAGISGAPFTDFTPRYLLGLLFLSLIGSVTAFTLYTNLLRAWGLGRAAYVSVLAPIVALGLSTLAEGYRWTPLAALGAALALAGALIAVRSRLQALKPA